MFIQILSFSSLCGYFQRTNVTTYVSEQISSLLCQLKQLCGLQKENSSVQWHFKVRG